MEKPTIEGYYWLKELVFYDGLKILDKPQIVEVKKSKEGDLIVLFMGWDSNPLLSDTEGVWSEKIECPL